MSLKDSTSLSTTVALPLGIDHATGKTVTFDFDESAKWTEVGNGWWLVVQTRGNQTGSVHIKRPPAWRPGDGITPEEIAALNIYGGHISTAPEPAGSYKEGYDQGYYDATGEWPKR
jgi:hypothetical protein